jgi:hypothetical protein
VAAAIDSAITVFSAFSACGRFRVSSAMKPSCLVTVMAS